MGRISSALALSAALAALSLVLSPAIAAVRDAIEKPLEAAERLARDGHADEARAKVRAAEAVGQLSGEEQKAVKMLTLFIAAKTDPDIKLIQQALNKYLDERRPRILVPEDVVPSNVGSNCPAVVLPLDFSADPATGPKLARWAAWVTAHGIATWKPVKAEAGKGIGHSCPSIDEAMLRTDYRLYRDAKSDVGVWLVQSAQPTINALARDRRGAVAVFAVKRMSEWPDVVVRPEQVIGSAFLTKHGGMYVIDKMSIDPTVITLQ